MEELTKYNNIQELKTSSKSMDLSSPKSLARHDSFERSMRALRQDFVRSTNIKKSIVS